MKVFWYTFLVVSIVVLGTIFYIVFDPLCHNIYCIPNHPQEFIVKNEGKTMRQVRYPHHGLWLENSLPKELQQNDLFLVCNIKSLDVSGSDEWPGNAYIDWCVRREDWSD